MKGRLCGVDEKPDKIKLFSFELTFVPLDINYHDSNTEFWDEIGFPYYHARTEHIKTTGKVSAYRIARDRANQYAKELGTHLKFWVSTNDLDLYYRSNIYLSKKPRFTYSNDMNSIRN